MSDHGSEEPERRKVEEEIKRHRVTTDLKELLGGPRVSAFGGELKGVERLVVVYREGAAHI